MDSTTSHDDDRRRAAHDLDAAATAAASASPRRRVLGSLIDARFSEQERPDHPAPSGSIPPEPPEKTAKPQANPEND